MSLTAKGVDVIDSKGGLTSTPNEVKLETDGSVLTAKNIILAPGSVPFVPRGIEVDEKTVFTRYVSILSLFLSVCMILCMY